MFLQAGALSLALLLASRLLGLARESALAAAFGSTGMADVAVLMLTLPDWIAGVAVSGALAYVLVPAWAGQGRAAVARSQRRVATVLLAGGAAVGAGLIALRGPALSALAPGVPPALQAVAAAALVASALALPGALLAALWVTRLQHERDFLGVYGANLVVNVTLIAAIVAVAYGAGDAPVLALGVGLLAAMALRLVWLAQRARRAPAAAGPDPVGDLAPAAPLSVWAWAALSAGLPLALPFAARSLASGGGEGALATFNYAWKLVELPLVLAIQLVATLAFPAIAAALKAPGGAANRRAGVPMRRAFALAWTLACACAAALLVAAPAAAQLLFGWGRMDGAALDEIARWSAVGAWGLLPQALAAVAVTALAAQRRLRWAAFAYGAALLALVAAGAGGLRDGGALMGLLNVLFAWVAMATLQGMGARRWAWLPWSALAAAAAPLAAWALAGHWLTRAGVQLGLAWGLALGALAACSVVACAWRGSADLRRALARRRAVRR